MELPQLILHGQHCEFNDGSCSVVDRTTLHIHRNVVEGVRVNPVLSQQAIEVARDAHSNIQLRMHFTKSNGAAYIKHN
jgi:hypothetical protein